MKTARFRRVPAAERGGVKMHMGGGMQQRAIIAGYVGAIALLPVWIALAHRAIAPTLFFLAILAAARADLWRSGRALLQTPRAPFSAAVIACVAFAVWASITGLWAPRADAVRLGLNILAPALAGGAVIHEVARRSGEARGAIAQSLAWAAIIAIALLAFEAGTGGWLRDHTPPTDQSQGRIKDWISLGRGATVVASIIFGALLLIYRMNGRRIAVAALFLMALYAAYRFHIFANVAGMTLGAGVFAIALKRPNAAIAAVAALWLAAFLLTPLAVFIPAEAALESLSGSVPVSWAQRLVIWQFAAEQALACQPFGCGADFARSLRESGGTIALPGWPIPASRMPVHPHNLFLQVWLEFGVIGVALFSTALCAGARAIVGAALSSAVKAAIAATAASLIVSALVELSVWQVWRLAAPCLAGLYIAAAANFDRQAPASSAASS